MGRVVGAAAPIALICYQFGAFATFAYLTLFDGYVYNAWNWIIALPINAFLGSIWPIYWIFLSWWA